MYQAKTILVKKEIALILVQFIALIGLATLAPLLVQQQAITGTLVNAVLFVAVILLGPQTAVLVGLVPSLIALSVGLLPAVLAPLVPFIMVANTVLVLVFSYLRKRNYWLAIVLASLFKFVFLFGASSLTINLLLKKEIAEKVALMMSWPQLLTALAGGLIACLFLKSIKKF